MNEQQGLIPGHPRGLAYLFFAELWERFSFYGMRALLMLYMTKQLFESIANKEAFAYGIYAAYGSLVYATPLIGGFLADKILGYRKAILFGAALMAGGHFMMAFESPTFFYIALALLVVGNGFFKPNISSLVGALYPPNDSRRDAGFTIFYMSINIGALISPLICGYLAEKYGWHFGFSLAGIGMLVGTIFFYRGAISGAFESEGLPATTNTAQTLFGIKYEYLVYLFSLLLIPTAMYLLVNAENMKWLLNSILIAVVTYLTYMLWGLANIERQRLLVVIILTISATTFWAFFEQAGSSLTLYADKNVNLIGINASQTNSINPLFIIAFAIPFSILWTYLSKRKNNPITPIKFGLAHLGLGIGFGFLAYSAQFMDEAAKVPMLFFIIGNLFITIGELCISPVGLSKITELTPKKLVSFMMGVWFLSVSFAHHIAGIVAKLTTQKLDLSEDSFSNTFITQITGITAKTLSENPIENLQSLAAYTSIFAQIALIAFAFALLTFALSPLLKKMMHGIN